MTNEQQLLRMDEVAARLSVSRAQVYALASRGELPGAIRVGKSLRVSAKALEAWIDRQAEKSTATA